MSDSDTVYRFAEESNVPFFIPDILFLCRLTKSIDYLNTSQY